MGDLSFKPIGEIQVGDEVIGFLSKNGLQGYANKSENSLCKSTVLSIRSRYSSTVKITMNSGNIIRCTRDHIWLKSQNKSSNWHYGKVKKHNYLARIITPTPKLNPFYTRLAGWLGGIYDGEGSGYHIAQYPDANPEVFNRIGEIAEILGINLTTDARRSGYYIKGGRQAFVDFLNITKPIKRKKLEERIMGRTMLNPRDKIISIEDDSEEEEVFCLTTTTGNYIVWGYASKNSASHPETVAVLCKWPSRRFRRFYGLHQKRQLIDGLRLQKDAMIAALWSNPNWDDTKESQGHRKNMIESVNADYEATVEYIESKFKSRHVETEEKLEDNPFFAAAERGLAQVDEYIGEQKKRGKPVRIQKQEENDYMKDVDQG